AEELDRHEREAQLRSEAAAAAADELRQSAAYGEAQGRIEAARRADDLLAAASRRHRDVESNLARATEQVREAALEDDVRRGEADERRADVGGAQDAVRQKADSAGIPVAGDVDGERL